MDALSALRLQLEWGADEALGIKPVNRLGHTLRTAPTPSPGPQQPARSPHDLPNGLPHGLPGARAAAQGDAASRARQAAEAAGDLDELRQALAHFDAFGLASTATSLVFGDGPAPSRLVAIGGAPGAEEDASGIAFSGPDGALLDRMLASIGLDRTRIRLTTVVPWRPPGGRPPSEAEIACCLPFLHRQIALLRPVRLVALGVLAARSLLGGREPISRLRGRWADIAIPGMANRISVLPMLHPAQLLVRPELKSVAWQDLRLLHRTLTNIADS